MPKDVLLQLILDEQFATSIEFKTTVQALHSIHYHELKDTKVKDKVLNTENRFKPLYTPLNFSTK